MDYYLAALYRDDHLELLYYSNDLEELLDDRDNFLKYGPKYFETMIHNYDDIRDTFIFKRLV